MRNLKECLGRYLEMLKAVDTDILTRLTITKDGEKISEILVPSMHGYIDVDKFKKVETVNDPMKCELNLRIEVQ